MEDSPLVRGPHRLEICWTANATGEWRSQTYCGRTWEPTFAAWREQLVYRASIYRYLCPQKGHFRWMQGDEKPETARTAWKAVTVGSLAWKAPEMPLLSLSL